jgi:type II secretory pathway component PulK
MRLPYSQTRKPPRRGYVLFAVLIVIVVLSLSAYRYSDAMGTEYRASVRNSELAQARMSALSGLHYAAGTLTDPIGNLGGNFSNNPEMFAAVEVGPGNPVRGGSRFTLMNIADNGGLNGQRYDLQYGVADESAKININAAIIKDPTGTALYNALMALPNMAPEYADCIVDWVDADSSPRNAGAEDSDYSAMSPPYRCKNGPLNSVDELLLVRGITPQLLYGNDKNRNGQQDPGEDDGTEFNRGWSEFLTCYGRDINVDSTEQPRFNINEPDIQILASNLYSLVGQEVADYILYFRISGTSQAAGSGGNNVRVAPASALRTLVETAINNQQKLNRKLSSVLTVYGTQIQLPATPAPPGMPAPPPTVVPCPLNDPAVLKQVLPLLMDRASTSANYELPPRVNVNNASREVLQALAAIGGNTITTADIDACLAAKANQNPTDVAYLTGAWLVSSGAMDPAKFKTIEPFITGRSYTYRAQSVGYFVNGGPVVRLEAVIDTGLGMPRFLYFRDLTDLGRGFTNLPK